MEDILKQWNKLDWDFFKKFVEINNLVASEEKIQQDFNNFVIDNKEKFDNPDYLQVFSENVEPSNKKFIEENFKMCKIFYDFMQNNPDWIKVNFDLRTLMRLGLFEDKFKQILENKQS